MSHQKPLRANLAIHNSSGRHALETAHAIKRLALLFDEIYVSTPTTNTINDSFIRQKEREWRLKGRNKTRTLLEFNYFRDSRESIALSFGSFNDPALRETLLVFEDAGVVKMPFSVISRLPAEVEDIKNQLVSQDIKDVEFNKISKTKWSDYDLRNGITTLTLKAEEQHERITVHAIREPPAVRDSKTLVNGLLIADQLSSIPIFPDNTHRAELNYKYSQYKEGLSILRKHYPEALADIELRAKIGEVAFSVTNEVFDSGALALCTPEEVLKYRAAMEDARRRYFSDDIVNIASMLKEGPWGDQARSEITKYINGKLRLALAQYENQSRATYRKFFGQFAAHSTSIVLGGGAGTLLGNVLPDANPWHLLLVGSLVGAAKEGTQVVKSIIDLWLQKKDADGSSIAFVAEFENKTSIKKRKQLMGIDGES